MTHHQAPLIALYDATPEHTRYGGVGLTRHAAELGAALARHGLGGVARSGSVLTLAVLSSLQDGKAMAMMLSPAASQYEHIHVFRLPVASIATLYTGRGALGADVCALASSQAVLVIGSDEEALSGILGCIGDRNVPIAILTDENPAMVRERIAGRYPELVSACMIATTPETLAKDLFDVVRRQHLSTNTK